MARALHMQAEKRLSLPVVRNVSKIEAKTGFDRIRADVAARCSTGTGAERAAGEEVSSSPEEIGRRLALADEMRVILMFESSFPDTDYVDCIPILSPLKAEYSHIDRLSLGKLRGYLDVLRRLLSFFRNCSREKYPRLKELASGVPYFPDIAERIDSILDRYGEIRDNASEELLSIRRAIRDKEGSASKRIQAILREAVRDGIADPDAAVSVRDGKMLIPVSALNKKKIPGIVYDESASGKTFFIEPIGIVELNNEIRQLNFDEQREIIRILTDFTDFLRPYIDDLLVSGSYIGEVDFIRAKASCAAVFGGGMPVISDRGELILKNARHPLLEAALRKEGKAIVPLDIVLTPEKRILLISGPNAGGKSVCLKTVGLLQYMFQWGMPVPASESSEMSVFEDIFIDIGDDQSIENDLSTYSSHLNNMKEIIGNADGRSLVLIDEFGSGTEPAAGGAIAEEILREIEEKGCYGVITTHYTNLKFYAGTSRSVINGAMLFDVQNIRPLFRLEIGLPGNSFAFELARKIGLPERIVRGAEERAGEDFVNIERNLKKIARSRRQLEERLTRIRATDRTLESITDRYQKELGEIKALRKEIIDRARAEAEEMLSGANRKIENTIREIRESQAEKQRTIVARRQLDDFAREVASAGQDAGDDEIDRKMARIVERKRRNEERRLRRERNARPASAAEPGQAVQEEGPVKPAAKEISVGSYVRIKDNGLAGKVIDISGTKLSVAVGDILTRTDMSKVEPAPAGVQKALSAKKADSGGISGSISERRLNFKPSIDIRGMRLDEAVPAVTRFIDDAVMVGVGEVSILHGKGNGILKEEIRKYLKITPGVASFGDEHVERGGSGITIVKLV